MKKRKLLSIVLSLALVFSMTSAFAVSSYAGEEDSEYIPVTPDTVTVNGVDLSVGEYYTVGASDGVAFTNKESTVDKYAYYKACNDGNAVLVLHNFELTVPDLSEDNYGITATASGDINALFIELEGTNSITMGTTTTEPTSANENPAIYADGLNLTISSNYSNGILTIKSNFDGIEANNFGLLSGKLTIEAEDNGISADSNVTISGGSLNVTDAEKNGIFASGSVIINGGKIVIGDEAVENSNFKEGIYAEVSVTINGGELSIFNVTSDGIHAEGSIIIKNGYIKIDGASGDNSDGIEADNDITISGGQVEITDVSDDGIEARNDVTISGGQVEIDGVSGKLNVSGDYSDGIYAVNDVTISGGQVEITDVDYDGIKACKGTVDITNAVVRIKSEDDGIDSINDITIKNSDVEVYTDSKNSDDKAFYPSVTVEGNPVVYAGSTSQTAVQVTDLSKLGSYQYVHILKDEQQGKMSIFSNITNAIKSLFTWFTGVKTGAALSNSFFGKLLASIFKFA